MGTDNAVDSGLDELARPGAEKDVATIESSPEITQIASPINVDRLEEERRVRKKIDAVVLPTVSSNIGQCSNIYKNSS
jgi:hypothetical protein